MALPYLPWSFFFHAAATALFLFLTSTTTTTTTTTRATTFSGNETDRVSLLAFKTQITHDPLRVMNSWNETIHFCGWYGVTCGRRHRRVTRLDLSSQSLAGSISPHIGNLTFLRRIDLVENNFTGKIPQEISHLFRLERLLLGNNSLVGEIPANLSHCINLKSIYLSFNMLGGKIPVELGSLLKLRFFDSDSNSLIGVIPHSLGNLSSLIVLGLPSNSLEGNIPDSLGRLKNLQFLFLGRNYLSGMVPYSIYNLSSIIGFALESNYQLYGSLPPEFGLALPNLEVFDLGGNQFSGSIPVSISNASKLAQLEITNNNFTGKVSINWGSLQGLYRLLLSYNHLGTGEADDLNFLTSLTNCSSLEILELGNNYFGGTLPNSIANLSSQLMQIQVGWNQILGTIPTGIGNLKSLTLLGLGYNQLTGSIPTTLGKLQQLNVLYFMGNRFSGPIPSSIGNLTQLTKLFFHENNLNGSIPPSIGKCKSLLTLDLAQNNFIGTIPQQVLGISSLSIYLDLSYNHFSGSLPLEVGNLNNLAQLDISENKLSGEIPNSLGHCRSLLYLYMEGNFFQGTIPESLSSLSAIEGLDLSRNNLSGQIPKYLGNFPFLRYLNLSFNDLEGEVPIEKVFKNATSTSIIGNRKLCGGVPELQLHACHFKEPKKTGMSLAIKLIVVSCACVICFIFASFFLIFYLRNKRRKEHHSTSSTRDRLLKISYQELLKATDGFSPVNLIGVGSFSTVFKGVLDQDESINVAVKVLNLQQRGASKSFMAECEALKNIRHRNLVKVITSCSTVDFQGRDFKAIVYKFMPNGSLERWLHPEADAHVDMRNLNFLQRLNIAIDVADAMDYLHHQCPTPIIHCDLKPSNVLLDNDMVAHVSDFGLARFLAGATNKPLNESSSVGLKGSIGYVAPEYAMGSELSIQGDVYSYGILLLEIFTGKRPTDNMFKDGLNLPNFARMALPEQVMEIIDPTLVSAEEEEEARGTNNIQNNWRNLKRDNKVRECLISVVRIGVACSIELPRERMNMSNVASELHLVKDFFLGVGFAVIFEPDR